MTKKVDAMIRELLNLVEGELGTSLAPDAAQRIKAGLCQAYGGERMYVEKLPKLVHQVRLSSIGTGQATATLAGQMGLSVRHVRRVVRGR